MTEDEWTRWVIEAAKWRGWMVTHFRPAKLQSGRWATPLSGHKGFPDLALAKGGRVLLRELKTDRGVLSPEQKVWLAALGEHGGVWRPRDRDKVLAELGVPLPVQLPASSGRSVGTAADWTAQIAASPARRRGGRG